MLGRILKAGATMLHFHIRNPATGLEPPTLNRKEATCTKPG
jgi:uncharacterized protein (DUF849 family)